MQTAFIASLNAREHVAHNITKQDEMCQYIKTHPEISWNNSLNEDSLSKYSLVAWAIVSNAPQVLKCLLDISEVDADIHALINLSLTTQSRFDCFWVLINDHRFSDGERFNQGDIKHLTTALLQGRRDELVALIAVHGLTLDFGLTVCNEYNQHVWHTTPLGMLECYVQHGPSYKPADTKALGFNTYDVSCARFVRRFTEEEITELDNLFRLCVADRQRGMQRARMMNGGFPQECTAGVFAMVIFLCDGLLIVSPTWRKKISRFFGMAQMLPLELQMILCNYTQGMTNQTVPLKDREDSFRDLARVFS